MSEAIEFINEKVQVVSIDSIQPHPQNPRRGDVGLVMESMQENGFYGSIIVQSSTGYVLVGNHRWRALKESEAQEVPVTFVDVDDDRALRILLADNRVSDVAEYDEAYLYELLMGLNKESDFGLEGTGFDEYALEDLEEHLQSLAPPPPAPPKQETPAGSEESSSGSVGSSSEATKITIRCTGEQYERIRETLSQWNKDGLTVQVEL